MSAVNKPIDLVGQQYGRLTVVERVETTRSGALWECVCACGGRVRKFTTSLRRKGFSGGCKACEPEVRAMVQVTHGGAHGGKSVLYRRWRGMRGRCTDPSNIGWQYYGGKGIKVCDEWQDFAVFQRWALANGFKPELTIERIDSDRDYEPDNCEWITGGENSRRALAATRARRAASAAL
jgi:hypothetical protein